jgi:serine/threonine-protein kinase RsbW
MKNNIDIEIAIPSHTRYLRMVGKLGEKVAEELDCPEIVKENLSAQFATVLTEGLVNAIKHAKCTDPDNVIHIRINVFDKVLMVRIFDNGVGFDLEAVPGPDFISGNLNEKGRGIFILRSLMDSVKYSRTNKGNVLEMRKNLV